jgi:prepilin peptidase CpaA
MHATMLVIAIAVLAVIAYGDVRFRRIPNAATLAIAALGLTRIILAQNAVAASYTLAAAAVIFAVTFLLFWRGAFGGGDAKLITAMALVIGHQQLLNFLFLMSASGGVLALVVLIRDKFEPALGRLCRRTTAPRVKTHPRVAAAENGTVPYGVAVAAAGAITLIIAR